MIQKNTPGTLRTLQLIHRAMLLGQVIFIAIAIFLKLSDNFPAELNELDKTFQVIAIVLCLAGFFIGSSVFKRKIQTVLDIYPSDVKEKAAAYRTASIVQWALLEGPSLFCIICFLLVGNYAFIALSVALMLLFALAAPVKLKVMLQLRLSEDEMEQF